MNQHRASRGKAEGGSSSPGPVFSDPSARDFEEFIYLISHDVRASVRALIELPQWIAEDIDDAGIRLGPSLRENIELMNRHTGRLDRMLVDLLTYSRVGRMQSVAEVDLDAALAEVLEEMTIPSGFTVVPALDCRQVVMGDRDVLTLLTALISNAIRHHDRDSGKVIVSAHKRGPDVILRVSDNGPGIEEAQRARVLEAMTTLRPRDEVEGSGMGLAIVRKITQIYDGAVRILDNGDKRGTVVEVRLPIPRKI
jgi:signal transduction histidine kinase